ncbi:MAG: DNA phosphorothioation system restriction enzyme [Ignavibacteriales bacterium]
MRTQNAAATRSLGVMLRDLHVRQSYRSDEHNLLEEFYVPCLERSTLYQRAVGFFSSSALSIAAKGLHAFLQGGGCMQLVASPYLSPEDIEEIRKGYKARELVAERAILRSLDEDIDLVQQGRLGILAWLIELSRLDVKVAVPDDIEAYGIYHEKIGVFSDGTDFVAFTGSPNESVSGLVSNFESIDVFCSWKVEDRDRAIDKRESFLRLWSDRTKRLRVFAFPEAAKRSLLRFRTERIPDTDPETRVREVPEAYTVGPRVPAKILLRPYQQDAVNNWLRNRGKGILKMATGSGKTITALAIAARLCDIVGLQGLLVVCPYRHLVTQWSLVCEEFGLKPVCCHESQQNWSGQLRAELYAVSSGQQPFVTAITTNATFASPAFQGALAYFPVRTLLVADEVHNLGSARSLELLPERITLRLALSATPERWFDDTGTEGLFEYFGGVIQPEFGLKDALKTGALVPYIYRPVLVTLTDDESEEYEDLTRKIAAAMSHTSLEEMQGNDYLTMLLTRRARLIGVAHNKLVELRRIMETRLDTTHTLFYCGDGSVEELTSQEMMRHVDVVCKMLGAELGYRVDVYVADTPLQDREHLRQRFERGEIQGLVAIRCLDEGIDIPSIRTAFILASSTNPRQFIQRRGRVLRPHPGKKVAEVYDFIVVPPDNAGEWSVERSLLQREIRRYVEFADLAVNSGEARGAIVELQQKYGLLGI